MAQAPPADLQELKARLQQLEVMMRSLQEQIAAVERTQKAQTTQAARPTTTPQLPGAPLPTTYIGQETRQRQTASDFPEEAPRIDNEELDPTLRGFFRIPGTQTLVNVRGFVKTDFFSTI